MGKDIAKSTHTFLFCDGGCCQKKGSDPVVRAARSYLRNRGLWDTTHTIKTRCNGRCEDAPTCIVNRGEYWYKELTSENIVSILESHIERDLPLKEHLLYQKGEDEVKSNNPRTSKKPEPFCKKNDSELGECYISRGFSSDQYLHPLFVYLSENPEGITLQLNDEYPLPFKKITEVVYTDKYQLHLITDDTRIPFTIAVVPKDDKELQRTKISCTEYFYQAEKQKAGVRFKNKFGSTLGHIFIDTTKSEAWEYCKTIQLLNTPLEI